MPAERAFTGAGFTIDRIVAGALDNNVYLVADAATGSALVVDAADDPQAIAAMASGHDVIGVFTTHGHHDHHGAVPDINRLLDAPFLLHPADTDLAGKEPEAEVAPGAFPIGATPARVVHTPGHTPGSVCLVLDGVVLTGDTLFPGGPGATRFPYSSFPTIIESIRSELFTLPDHTVVLPGHGAATTMGTERPHLGEWIGRGW